MPYTTSMNWYLVHFRCYTVKGLRELGRHSMQVKTKTIVEASMAGQSYLVELRKGAGSNVCWQQDGPPVLADSPSVGADTFKG